MVVSNDTVEVTAEELSDRDAIVASDMVMGNGIERGHPATSCLFGPENFSLDADAGNRR